MLILMPLGLVFGRFFTYLSMLLLSKLQEEQFMYPSSLENESFVVALVNSKRQGYCDQSLTRETDTVSWEITRALRYE